MLAHADALGHIPGALDEAADLAKRTNLKFESEYQTSEPQVRTVFVCELHGIYTQFTEKTDWYTKSQYSETKTLTNGFSRLVRFCYQAASFRLSDTTIERDISSAKESITSTG